MAIKQQRSLDPATRLRNARLRIRVHFITASLLVLFFTWQAADAVINDHYRNDPDTQTITATVTSTKRDCTRNGCSYNSYGNYSIYGVQEHNIKVVSLTDLPVTGQVPILVNPKRPRTAMPYYGNPYLVQALGFGSLAAFFLLWNGFSYFVLYRRTKRRLLMLVGNTKPTEPSNPIS